MKDLGFYFIIILVFICVLLFVPWLTKSLWNWLMPELFGFKQINMIQALGIVVLMNLIFGIRVNNK